jgi:hypothetical protein
MALRPFGVVCGGWDVIGWLGCWLGCGAGGTNKRAEGLSSLRQGGSELAETSSKEPKPRQTGDDIECEIGPNK